MLMSMGKRMGYLPDLADQPIVKFDADLMIGRIFGPLLQQSDEATKIQILEAYFFDRKLDLYSLLAVNLKKPYQRALRANHS